MTLEVVVRFDSKCQDIGPLQEAAYRLIGLATCQIELVNDAFECRLITTTDFNEQILSEDGLRRKFLDLVTDENLREKISSKTAAMRDVILALAFGSLAKQQESGNCGE